MEEPTEAFTSRYTRCTWVFVSPEAGTAGSCGNVSPKSEKDFSSSHPQSIYRWLLHCQTSLQHRGEVWKETHVSTSHCITVTFTEKPQNANPADRIPQTTLQSNNTFMGVAASQLFSHIPAFWGYKIPFSPPSQHVDEQGQEQVSASKDRLVVAQL